MTSDENLADPADRDEVTRLRTQIERVTAQRNREEDEHWRYKVRAERAEAEVARQHKVICRLERTVEGYEKYPVDGAEVIAKENAELRAMRDRVRALADRLESEGINCACGHGIGGEHNSLGCYARISYEPLVTCSCTRDCDQSEADIAAGMIRAALDGAGEQQ